MSRTALFTKTNAVAAVVAIGIIGGSAAFLLDRPANQMQPVAQPVVQEASTSQAEVRADYVSYAGQDGKNALELLKLYTDVQTENSSFGEFVQSINGQDGSGQKYWTFYVNGEMAQVGAGAYQTKSADKLEWKLQ